MSIIKFTDFIIPFILSVIIICGIFKKVDVFTEFIEGAWDNIKTGVMILPALLGLMLCINMFKASGSIELISSIISPVTSFLGFPEECVPLALIRPVSGSGAIAIYEGIITENSPDSFIGRVASVLLGSTETTFYTIAIYFGATRVKKTRQTLVASLSADLTGFILSALLVRMIFI